MIEAPTKLSPTNGISGQFSLTALMTRERWIEVIRIVATGLVALLFWQNLVPVELLWLAVAIGL